LSIWLIFILSGIFIIISGRKLSIYGDIISLKTGMGQALVGGILIAGATSLPEVVTSSTAAILDAPDIAVGNLFGSNTFNLLILALVDLFHGSGPMMLKVHSKHILGALLGVLLSAMAAVFILEGGLHNLRIEFLGIGLGSLIILITYLLGSRLIFRYEKRNKIEEKNKEKKLYEVGIPLKKAITNFLLAAAVIIISGILLSYSGDQIARLTGIDETFVGTILIAAATTLPEFVVVLAAIRINAYDMAVGNVFGSNIFNMAILIITDIVYRQGSIFAAVSLSHTITALVGLILSAIAVIGLFYRSEKTFIRIGWDSVFIILVYIGGIYLLFNIGLPF